MRYGIVLKNGSSYEFESEDTLDFSNFNPKRKHNWICAGDALVARSKDVVAILKLPELPSNKKVGY